MLDRTTCYDNLDQPQKRGHATEAIVQAAFALRDIPVLVPTYTDEPYDLVVEVGGRFHRLECKTAYRRTAGTVAFDTASTRPRHGCNRDGYGGRAEYFAVYDPINDGRYLVPVTTASGDTLELRFRETNRDECAGIDRTEEYLLEDRLAELRQHG